MAIRSLAAALGLIAVVAASSPASAQMAGYPNGGGRLPGSIAAGPTFPNGPAPSQNYGSQPVYVAPPTNAYAPAPGTDPLTGAPAVSYGTPQPAPQSPYQQAPSQPTVNTQALPVSQPIATPYVATPGGSAPAAATPVVVGPAFAPQQQTPTLAPPLPPIVTPLPAGTPGAAAPNVYSGSYGGNSTAPQAYAGQPVYSAAQTQNAPQTYAAPQPDPTIPPAIPQYAPNYNQAPTEMPVGRLTQKEISPFARGSSPPSFSAWLPRAWKPQAAPLYDNTPANSNYGAVDPNAGAVYGQSGIGQSGFSQPVYGQPTYGQPVYGQQVSPFYPGQNCGPGVPGPCAPHEPWYTNFAIITTVDAFKTPVDLDGLNANFGRRVGAMASFPILRDWGFGGQVSSTAGWYDWKGTQFTGDEMRFQNFNSIGLFQRSCTTGLGFGIAHDWLYDDYYSLMHLSQFRAAVSWEINCNNEVGVWAAFPQRRDSAFVGTPTVENHFQSLTQGNLYWKHYWSDCAWSNVYAGLAESPSDIPCGANMQVAVNRFMAVTGAATYVVPGSGGTEGRQEEIWSLSFGLLFYPGTAMSAQRSQFRPIFAPADNGNFATWRR